MKKRNIIIDCDPGVDDILALSLAIANEDKLNILGITTVAGNQTIETVTENTLKLISYYGKNIKIAKGHNSPLIREKAEIINIHGENGMGDYQLPETNLQLVSDNAVTFLRDIIINSVEKVTLVPIGPLTNIALLIKTFPEVKNNIELISIMGGSAREGNRTQFAEFNIWADPEAARIVFDSGLPIVMSGLNVTHNTGLFREDVNDLLKSKGKISSMLGKMLNCYFRGDNVKEGSFTPIHDACAIMYLLHPEIYKYVHTNVIVDCSEEINRGHTSVDLRDWIKYDESYPKVLIEADTEEFRKILLENIYKLDDLIS